MPIKNTYGDALPIGSVGDRQVVAVPASKAASPPIQADRYARNGQHPNAALINAMNESGNQAVLYRSKQLAYVYGRLGQNAGSFSSPAQQIRWRFACHTGPYTHAMLVEAVMLPDQVSPTNTGKNQALIEVFSGADETSLVGSLTLTYGLHPRNDASTGPFFSDIKVLSGYINVNPDTDYYIRVSNVDYGRIQSLCIADMQSMTQNFSGYLAQNLAGGSAVLDVYRRKLSTLMYNLWRRGGASVLNWTVDDAATPVQRTANTTPVNIIDTSITTVSASSPGYWLVMDRKARLGQSGVPCVMKAFGAMSAGTNGSVLLKNSAGVTVASISSAFTTTPSWKSVAFNLPATTDKYDLQVQGPASGTLSLHAISIYEQD